MDIISKFFYPQIENIKQTKKLTIILAGGVIIVLVSYNFKKWLHMRSYFKKCNIQGPKPYPIMGNLYALLKKGITKHDIEIMEKYGPTFGYFEGSTPLILTKDPKFIKNVMIKDFNYFVNRRVFESIIIEPTDKFLTVLKDEEWKNVRAIITTAFTSGKLKSMSKCIIDCTNNLNQYLNNVVEKDGILDTKQLFGSFTLDTITSCCFGFELNSLNDSDNELLKHLQALLNNSLSFSIKTLLIFLLPSLANYLSKKGLITFFPKKSLNYIEGITNEILKRRRQKLERRDDFIQIVVEHEENCQNENQPKKEETNTENVYKWNSNLKKTLTNGEIVAQAILFLFAGFETTATTLSFIAHSLAMNYQVQQKLIQEVDSILDQHNGSIDYETISEMNYMDKVIDETLRMYPPATRLDRVANADYEYEGIKVRKGQIWTVPIWAMHHDSEIYPEPYKFDPERFNEQNKRSRENTAFLPFGAGPRNCVGMRFALLEIKFALTTILSKYQFEKCEKTTENIEIDSSGLARPVKPIYVKVSRR